jgi:hypothetical protein
MSTEPGGIAIIEPLLVATLVTSVAILIRGLAFGAIITFVRHEEGRGRAGISFWGDLSIVSVSAIVALGAHLMDMFIWAATLSLCDRELGFAEAIYGSMGNYTSLGADIALSPSWRLLAPLETADGLLMFGLSTALLFAVVQHLVQTRLSAENMGQQKTSAVQNGQDTRYSG